ncbi:MAG: FeoA family protein [Gammaproteobacteria bacterium]|nr:FeoA family protein [Gammaproteobacteria bacterium]
MKPLPPDHFTTRSAAARRFPDHGDTNAPPRPAAYRCGAAGSEQRLSLIDIGRRVTIRRTADHAARRRLALYGLIEGVDVIVEKRGGAGDLIVRFDAARYFIPAHLAHAIWVSPGGGSDPPKRDQ